MLSSGFSGLLGDGIWTSHAVLGLPDNERLEATEEFVGHFLRSRIDQPSTDLGEFPADGRLDAVNHYGRIAVFGQIDRSTHFREACDSARALSGHGVALRRIPITQGHTAFEFRFDRPNL